MKQLEQRALMKIRWLKNAAIEENPVLTLLTYAAGGREGERADYVVVLWGQEVEFPTGGLDSVPGE
jgi:hypothetical protein